MSASPLILAVPGHEQVQGLGRRARGRWVERLSPLAATQGKVTIRWYPIITLFDSTEMDRIESSKVIGSSFVSSYLLKLHTFTDYSRSH